MKRLVIMICSCLGFVYAGAQVPLLSITTDKTTSLVFPFSIRHVDRGTQDILAQQVKEADNILLVKASVKGFSETNLSVVTDDGNVYTFNVCYDPHPMIWVYNLPANKKATISTYATGILDNPETVKGLKDESWNITAKVTGIYTKDDVAYYQIELINDSRVDFGIDMLRFYIKDKKKGKRTAVQENELKPLYVAGNARMVKAHEKNVIAVAMQRYTLPEAKFMEVQIMEKNGGRNLQIKVTNKKIMKAVILPDLR